MLRRTGVFVPIILLLAGCAGTPRIPEPIPIPPAVPRPALPGPTAPRHPSGPPDPLEALGGISPPRGAGKILQTGTASYYGRRFHGRRTASGERFDMHDLTAAHPTLPFGTRLKVTNLENGRSVVVRVNDRGPFVGDRIIDLSLQAARELGFVRQGLARVYLMLEP